MATRLKTFQTHWNETREGYRRWYKLWTQFYPEQTTPSSAQQPMFFDGWMVMALAAIEAGSTDPAAVAAAYAKVANPPGTVYYPDQFKEARAAILRGEDIDYEGAQFSDFTENLEPTHISAWGVFQYDIDSVSSLSSVFVVD
jgi:branched-chain amino acid transport system substrate-binding protein